MDKLPESIQDIIYKMKHQMEYFVVVEEILNRVVLCGACEIRMYRRGRFTNPANITPWVCSERCYYKALYERLEFLNDDSD